MRFGNIQSNDVCEWRIFFRYDKTYNLPLFFGHQTIRAWKVQKVAQHGFRVSDPRREAGLVQAVEGEEVVCLVAAKRDRHGLTLPLLSAAVQLPLFLHYTKRHTPFEYNQCDTSIGILTISCYDIPWNSEPLAAQSLSARPNAFISIHLMCLRNITAATHLNC